MRRSSVRFRQAAPAKAQVRGPFMVAGSNFWGDVDEPMSRPTGLPEPRQHAIRWTCADVDGPPEAGVTSDLLSENEKVTWAWPSATRPRGLSSWHGICRTIGRPTVRQRWSTCRWDCRNFQATRRPAYIEALSTSASATIPPRSALRVCVPQGLTRVRLLETRLPRAGWTARCRCGRMSLPLHTRLVNRRPKTMSLLALVDACGPGGARC